MKKKISLLLTIILLVGVFVGCGKNSYDPSTTDEERSNVSEIYVPESHIVNPPVVIQEISTKLPDTSKGPAVALMQVDENLNVLGKKERKIFTAEKFVEKCSATVIPAFIIDSAAEGEALCAFLQEREIIDAFVVADSADAELVYQVRQTCTKVRGILIFDSFSDKEAQKAACQLANDSLANVIISRQPLSQDEVCYFTIRAVAVWSYAADEAGIYQAISSGYDGVIATDPKEVYEVYSSIPQVTVSGRPLPIAHRGNRAFSENTLESFQGAIDAGCLAVETDLRLTKDKQIVLLHDATLDRTTDGAGEVSRVSLEEVKSYSCDDVAGMSTKVPTFREALEMFGDTDLVFFCELKATSGSTFRDAFNSVAAGYEDNVVLFVGFGSINEYNYKNILDGIPFVAGNYEPLLNDEDDLVTIEKFIQRLAPYNYQPLFYDYEPNHQREDFYYEMAARGFLPLHSTTKQEVLNERLLTGQGASGALTNEPWLTADYAYKINVENMTLSVGQEIPLKHEVIKMVGSDTVTCELLQLSGPKLSQSTSGYSAQKAGEAIVVFSATIEANGANYTIYSAPVCVTITD